MKHIEEMNHRVLYWSLLLVLGIASILLTFVLMPMILLLPAVLIYVLVLAIGLLFGFIFSFLVMDLQHLSQKHHWFLAIYVPVLTVIDIYVLMMGTSKLADHLQIQLQTSPIIVAFFLLFSFTLPYLFFGMTHLFKK